MSGSRSGHARWTAGLAAAALGVSLAALTPASASAAHARAVSATDVSASAVSASAVSASAARPIPLPRHLGRLRITGVLRDGGTVTAAGLTWHPGRLPRGDKLLTFAVGYAWRACPSSGKCGQAADSTATPFAARRYVVGHADTGKRLALTVTATEVVETNPKTFAFSALSSSVRVMTAAAARAYPARPAAGDRVRERHPGTPDRLA